MIGPFLKVVIIAAAVLGLGYAVVSMTVGVTGENLAYSVAGEAGSSGYLTCRRLTGRGRWECPLMDGGEDFNTYVVTNPQGRCWSARRVGRPIAAPSLRKRLSGCVDAYEVIAKVGGFGAHALD